MRSINYTFLNNGSSFVFRTDKMTRHPYKARGATMLQVHALLTLEGQKAGDNVTVLNTRGKSLSQVELEHAARTGEILNPS